VVTDEEIEAQYEKVKQGTKEPPPLDEIRDKLKRQVTDIKRREKLIVWVKSLRENAEVEINRDKLYQ
jgi:hypothetical protein